MELEQAPGIPMRRLNLVVTCSGLSNARYVNIVLIALSWRVTSRRAALSAKDLVTKEADVTALPWQPLWKLAAAFDTTTFSFPQRHMDPDSL